MNIIISAIITGIFTGGFFSFIQFLIIRKDKNKNDIQELIKSNKELQDEYKDLKETVSKQSAMLMGLGHDRIIEKGSEYLNRQYITKDEYEDLYDYLFVPYHNLGGNGTAEKVMGDVKNLPIRKE